MTPSTSPTGPIGRPQMTIEARSPRPAPPLWIKPISSRPRVTGRRVERPGTSRPPSISMEAPGSETGGTTDSNAVPHRNAHPVAVPCRRRSCTRHRPCPGSSLLRRTLDRPGNCASVRHTDASRTPPDGSGSRASNASSVPGDAGRPTPTRPDHPPATPRSTRLRGRQPRWPGPPGRRRRRGNGSPSPDVAIRRHRSGAKRRPPSVAATILPAGLIPKPIGGPAGDWAAIPRPAATAGLQTRSRTSRAGRRVNFGACSEECGREGGPCVIRGVRARQKARPYSTAGVARSATVRRYGPVAPRAVASRVGSGRVGS